MINFCICGNKITGGDKRTKRCTRCQSSPGTYQKFIDHNLEHLKELRKSYRAQAYQKFKDKSIFHKKKWCTMCWPNKALFFGN